VLAPLAPPAVIHYTGHMIAPPGRPGRFRAEQETQIAAAIASKLEQHGVAFGYGALACGATSCLPKRCSQRALSLHVVLPFSREDFIRVSVAPGGAGWIERFEACLQRARTITYATDDSYLGHDWIFSYGSFVAMGLAVLRARFLDGAVRQLACGTAKQRTVSPGTAFDVGTWRSLNRPADIILCGAPSQERGRRQPPSRRRRVQGELKTMLFGDVQGIQQADRGADSRLRPARAGHARARAGTVRRPDPLSQYVGGRPLPRSRRRRDRRALRTRAAGLRSRRSILRRTDCRTRWRCGSAAISARCSKPQTRCRASPIISAPT
jgi:hypothetical protein